MSNQLEEKKPHLKSSIKTLFKVLSFSIQRREILNFNKTDLYLGVFITWIVGMGRYWDDPGAKLPQLLGVGSLAYIFILSLFLWLIFKPLKIKNWSYANLLTFTSLTSLPALLYAIPIERFLDFSLAAKINVYFLLIVALWRVILLAYYFRVFGGLTKFETFIATTLPLTVIISSLTMLNLERAVFNIMSGMSTATSNDSAYAVLAVMTGISLLLTIPLLIFYLIIIYRKNKKTI